MINNQNLPNYGNQRGKHKLQIQQTEYASDRTR